MRRWLIIAAITVSLLAGCRKKQAPPPPPVTLPPPIVPSQTPVVEPPAVRPVPPAIPEETPPTEMVPGKPERIAPPPAPPVKPARRVRTPRRAQPAPPATPPAPQPDKAETPPAKPPQLGELLGETETGRYRQQYESYSASARASLETIAGRTLNRSQADTAARVTSFVQEAQKLRETDIRAAAQLASRAASLGRDLVNSLK